MRQFIRIAALAATCLLPLPAAAQGATSFTPQQRAAIVEIIREALRNDPTILEEAIAALQARDMAREREAARGAIVANRDALLNDATLPAKGAERPTATIVEFFDYRCPYCKRMSPVITELLGADRGVRVVLVDIPILGPASVTAARAALAAQRQGKYAEMHDGLMALRGEPTEAAIMQLAGELRLDRDRLRRDMADPAIGQRIEANLRLAQALGVQGTPAYVVGNEVLPGAVGLDQLREAIARSRRAPG
ncbi:DsbA family protein [Elioraea rosea]|uniref:DsbA family protein n=1 Tax=Elioraea rosea TaxID=2492390 RepID=UPI001186B0F1|nr:DsbA family protein [Elioraea rosea]